MVSEKPKNIFCLTAALSSLFSNRYGKSLYVSTPPIAHKIILIESSLNASIKSLALHSGCSFIKSIPLSALGKNSTSIPYLFNLSRPILSSCLIKLSPKTPLDKLTIPIFFTINTSTFFYLFQHIYYTINFHKFTILFIIKTKTGTSIESTTPVPVHHFWVLNYLMVWSPSFITKFFFVPNSSIQDLTSRVL